MYQAISKIGSRSISLIASSLLMLLSSAVVAQAASFEFAQEKPTFDSTCTTSLNLYADPQGESSRSADISILYDPTKITGVQVNPGDAYQNYYGNEVNTSLGRIRLTGANLNSVTTARKVFAVISFQALTTGTINLNINFSGTGATLDSNIAGSDNLDKLTSVTNFSYTITSQDCAEAPEGEEPPVVPPESTPTEEPEEPSGPGSLPETPAADCSGANLIKCVITGEVFIKDLILPREIKEFITSLTLPGLAATTLTLFELISLLSLLLALRSPLLIYFFILGLLKRKRRPWGLILDDKDKRIITFAALRLFSQDTGKLVSTSVSDLQGRYSFVIKKGKYRLEIEHPYYVANQVNLEILSDEDNLDLDIFLTRREEAGKVQAAKKSEKYKTHRTPWILRKRSQLLIILGFVFSVIATIVSPLPINFIILAGYLIQLVVLALVYYSTPRRWGEILDAAKQNSISNAQVKIYNPKNWHLVDTQLSSDNGRFGFFLDPGEYAVQVAAFGYNYPSVNSKDVIKTDKGLALIKFNYTPEKRFSLKLLVDAIVNLAKNSNTTPNKGNVIEPNQNTITSTDSLANPFSGNN